jgi:hypothetical protein
MPRVKHSQIEGTRAYRQELAMKLMRHALEKIAKLGRVCDDFEVCEHSACLDSCQAALIALDALQLLDTPSTKP